MSAAVRMMGVAALALAGCGLLAHGGEPTLTIRGSLGLPAHTVLPAGAQWVVELRDETSDRVLTEQRAAWGGRPSPIPFVLSVDIGKLVPSHTHALRAAVLAQGHARWLSESTPIEREPGTVDLGELPMSPARFPGAFSSTLRCGERSVVIGYIGSMLRLTEGRQVFDLAAVPGGGAVHRFELASDASTFVELDDRGAWIAVQGQPYARCESMTNGK